MGFQETWTSQERCSGKGRIKIGSSTGFKNSPTLFGNVLAKELEEWQGPGETLEWTPECRKGFDTIKAELMRAPALGLLDLTKPFTLYVHERQHVALGVLTQTLGDWRRRVAYFSKQLDEVSKGWPACLRAVAAVVLLVKAAQKLTLGQPIIVFVPHAVMAVLEQKGHHWISPSRLAQYQAVLIEQDDVTLKMSSTLNPATLMPIDEKGELEHDCLHVIEKVYSSRPDLRDVPLSDPEVELFTDGSSFMVNGEQKAGYAVITLQEEVKAQALPPNTSAQKAEIIAMTRALELSKDKRVNIYTDSKYTFGVVHAHGAIWKERGLLSSQGTPIKYGPEILKLLQAVLGPKEVAIVHCKAHQKGQTEVIKGNRKADETAKRVAEKESWIGALIPPRKVHWEPPLGEVRQGQTLGEYWQVDFSELPTCNQFKHLLVLVDTFSGWPESLPVPYQRIQGSG
ncbi:LOW QUALITY PROTEIN: uncharacterized protein LOC143172179 [Aptenodytes patagonicus]|uniref:LOW QUALITY PROTEIN: uncharacterized protein LOC143172179 n=1 Tax=Aptenodytes patagonicus TaxID=9234 RepID=UPI003F9F4C31